MSDYTPTTEEIRGMFMKAVNEGKWLLPEALGEFDRWLESLQTNTQEVSVQADEDHPKLEGMFLVSKIFGDAYDKCRDAMDVVSSAEYELNGESDMYNKFEFARSMFAVLEDFFGDKYREKLAEVKREVGDV